MENRSQFALDETFNEVFKFARRYAEELNTTPESLDNIQQAVPSATLEMGNSDFWTLFKDQEIVEDIPISSEADEYSVYGWRISFNDTYCSLHQEDTDTFVIALKERRLIQLRTIGYVVHEEGY